MKSTVDLVRQWSGWTLILVHMISLCIISRFHEFNRVAILFGSVKYCFGILFRGFSVAQNVLKQPDTWTLCLVEIC